MTRINFGSIVLAHLMMFTHTVSAGTCFSITKSRDMYTGMQTSKIELAETEADCKRLRANTRSGILTNEYVELISSSCSSELPSKYNNIVFNRPIKGALYIVYEKDGISTKEIFYGVEPGWSNVKACEVISSRYEKVVQNIFCVGGLAK